MHRESERFAADWERQHGKIRIPEINPNGKKWHQDPPAGLTCAGELVKEGFDVTVFEALHEAEVFTYGIPEFRLPKEIVKQEVSYLENSVSKSKKIL